ncbi:MAG: hypothetical protein M3135_07855, partial [Actinomycetota bacterium]|nr:hypothetical protein [Actinomycetota bacterium]
MSDLRSMLERKADEVRIHSELPRELSRRIHRRRWGTATLAVVVVGGLALGSFASIQAIGRLGDGPARFAPRPGEAPENPSVVPIWPVGTAEDIDRIQESVDQGHQPSYLSPPI